MTLRFSKKLIVFSLCLNLLVTIPALVLFFTSSSIQYALYQNVLAPRLGSADIAFVGDSITRYGDIWGLKIGEYNFNVWNFGHVGYTTRQMHSYLRNVIKQKPKIAFVMAGINDPDKSITGAHQSFKNYRFILDSLINAGTEPVIQLTLYRKREKHPDFIDELNRLLVLYAQQNNLTVIDLNPLLSREKSLLDKYSLDGVHLTAAAYKVWSKEIKQVLNQKEMTEKK